MPNTAFSSDKSPSSLIANTGDGTPMILKSGKGYGMAVELNVSAEELLSKVSSVLEHEEERRKLFESLRQYHELRKIKGLVRDLKMILNSEKKQPLFKEIRALIPPEHVAIYDKLTELSKNTDRLVRIKKIGNEAMGFTFRGGLEHGIGFFVTSITPGSASHIGGLKVGDEILKINGLPLNESIHYEVLSILKSKAQVTLLVKYAGRLPNKINNQVVWIEVQETELNQLKENETPLNGIGPHKDRLLAFQVGKAGLGCSIRSGIKEHPGIFVVIVGEKSLANRVGLKVGDQILDINGKDFTNISHEKAILYLKSKTQLNMIVRHNQAVEEIMKRKKEEFNAKIPKSIVEPVAEDVKKKVHFGVDENDVFEYEAISEDEETDDESPDVPSALNFNYPESLLENREVHFVAIPKNGPLYLNLEYIDGIVVVKDIPNDGAVAWHGFIRPGDWILNVEGEDLLNANAELANTAIMEAMKRWSKYIEFIVACQPGRNPPNLPSKRGSKEIVQEKTFTMFKNIVVERPNTFAGVRGAVTSFETSKKEEIQIARPLKRKGSLKKDIISSEYRNRKLSKTSKIESRPRTLSSPSKSIGAVSSNASSMPKNIEANNSESPKKMSKKVETTQSKNVNNCEDVDSTNENDQHISILKTSTSRESRVKTFPDISQIESKAVNLSSPSVSINSTSSYVSISPKKLGKNNFEPQKKKPDIENSTSPESRVKTFPDISQIESKAVNLSSPSVSINSTSSYVSISPKKLEKNNFEPQKKKPDIENSTSPESRVKTFPDISQIESKAVNLSSPSVSINSTSSYVSISPKKLEKNNFEPQKKMPDRENDHYASMTKEEKESLVTNDEINDYDQIYSVSNKLVKQSDLLNPSIKKDNLSPEKNPESPAIYSVPKLSEPKEPQSLKNDRTIEKSNDNTLNANRGKIDIAPVNTFIHQIKSEEHVDQQKVNTNVNIDPQKTKSEVGRFGTSTKNVKNRFLKLIKKITDTKAEVLNADKAQSETPKDLESEDSLKGFSAPLKNIISGASVNEENELFQNDIFRRKSKDVSAISKGFEVRRNSQQIILKDFYGSGYLEEETIRDSKNDSPLNVPSEIDSKPKIQPFENRLFVNEKDEDENQSTTNNIDNIRFMFEKDFSPNPGGRKRFTKKRFETGQTVNNNVVVESSSPINNSSGLQSHVIEPSEEIGTSNSKPLEEISSNTSTVIDNTNVVQSLQVKTPFFEPKNKTNALSLVPGLETTPKTSNIKSDVTDSSVTVQPVKPNTSELIKSDVFKAKSAATVEKAPEKSTTHSEPDPVIASEQPTNKTLKTFKREEERSLKLFSPDMFYSESVPSTPEPVRKKNTSSDLFLIESQILSQNNSGENEEDKNSNTNDRSGLFDSKKTNEATRQKSFFLKQSNLNIEAQIQLANIATSNLKNQRNMVLEKELEKEIQTTENIKPIISDKTVKTEFENDFLTLLPNEKSSSDTFNASPKVEVEIQNKSNPRDLKSLVTTFESVAKKESESAMTPSFGKPDTKKIQKPISTNMVANSAKTSSFDMYKEIGEHKQTVNRLPDYVSTESNISVSQRKQFFAQNQFEIKPAKPSPYNKQRPVHDRISITETQWAEKNPLKNETVSKLKDSVEHWSAEKPKMTSALQPMSHEEVLNISKQGLSFRELTSSFEQPARYSLEQVKEDSKPPKKRPVSLPVQFTNERTGILLSPTDKELKSILTKSKKGSPKKVQFSNFVSVSSGSPILPKKIDDNLPEVRPFTGSSNIKMDGLVQSFDKKQAYSQAINIPSELDYKINNDSITAGSLRESISAQRDTNINSQDDVLSDQLKFKHGFLQKAYGKIKSTKKLQQELPEIDSNFSFVPVTFQEEKISLTPQVTQPQPVFNLMHQNSKIANSTMFISVDNQLPRTIGDGGSIRNDINNDNLIKNKDNLWRK